MPKSPCLVILGVAKSNGIWYNNKMSGSQIDYGNSCQAADWPGSKEIGNEWIKTREKLAGTRKI